MSPGFLRPVIGRRVRLVRFNDLSPAAQNQFDLSGQAARRGIVRGVRSDLHQRPVGRYQLQATNLVAG